MTGKGYRRITGATRTVGSGGHPRAPGMQRKGPWPHSVVTRGHSGLKLANMGQNFRECSVSGMLCL